VILVVAGVLGGTSTSSSAVNQGMRAVVVPTEATRTVVVTPCGTGVPASSFATPKVLGVVGVTVVSLPKGTGVRMVLVPPCAAGSRATAGTSLLPSAAFVPREGTPVPPIGTAASSGSDASSGSGPVVADPRAATSRLRITPGSDVRLVVVAPCTHTKTGPLDTLLGSSSGTPGLAVAPAC
jgi:hypothetical protein